VFEGGLRHPPPADLAAAGIAWHLIFPCFLPIKVPIGFGGDTQYISLLWPNCRYWQGICTRNPANFHNEMKKKQLIKKIMGIEIIGFLSAILIVWLNELLDLPHIFFGAFATPINYFESIIESTIIFLLGVVIILLTRTILHRLKHLEGILPVCSFCNKIRSGKQWIPIENYVSHHSEADFSHSVCPECADKHYEIKLN
jgi:hypothetical protein